MITIQLPGGTDFKLGFAGGPLIVALILGAIKRTGPMVWTIPYSANLTLRQIGLILLLAGIGINLGKVNLALDYKPAVNIVGGDRLLQSQAAVSVRYILGRTKKQGLFRKKR